MKKQKNSIINKLSSFLVMIVFVTNSMALTVDELDFIEMNGGDITKVPIEKEPGVDAVQISEIIHSKEIEVDQKEISFKWTTLGYGANTHKVILPELASHTLFNHRNPGEDGPCLRSDRLKFNNLIMDKDGKVIEQISSPDQLNLIVSDSIKISIKILNNYIIDRLENVCKVQMVEDVRTVINGEEFYHVMAKDMGYRFIEDCPK